MPADVLLVIYIGLAFLGAIGVVFLLISLRTAGHGAFLKERNEELAGALEQVRAQRDDDRNECRQEIQELRDQVNQLRGELNRANVKFAEVIAREVIVVLHESGVLPSA